MPDRPSSPRWRQAVKGNLIPAWIKTCRTVVKKNRQGRGGDSSYENAWSPEIFPHLQKNVTLKFLPASFTFLPSVFLLPSLLRISLALSMQERCAGIDPAAIDNAVLRETHQLLMAMQIVETRELFTVISLWFGKCPCLMWSLTWYIIPLQFK